MPSDYAKITEENKKKYGTDIGRYGQVLLANLYSDRTHFVYELLQNAEDAKAKWVNFHLFKDRLKVCHNGRPFNHDDIIGICGLVEGTKKEDLMQIGKFGIGFKSVYAYTCTPMIYSDNESFTVENYVLPQGIEKVELKDNETLFIFPFNHNEISPEQTFKDISRRLRELGPQILLFLNNIEEINWDIEGEESEIYIRNSKPQGGNLREVYIISKVGNKKDKDEEWLIFERPIKQKDKDVSKLKVEVAFKMDREGKDKEKVIIPADNSYLVVFFPTEKETHLKFLIQGPYKTTPARDNIPKEDEWNKELIKETALLVADSILKIRKLGLLTVDFLNILPISEDDFPKDHMFFPIYNAVLNKLKSDEKLLPSSGSRHISANQAFLARGKGLIDLLKTKQLSLLFKKQNARWLNSNITQDKTPELKKYLLEKLKVIEVDPEKFANQFTEEFIKEQSDEWVIGFYVFLKDQKSLWEFYWSSLRSKPFIRLENNIHVAFLKDRDKPKAYLPGNSDSSFPTVKKFITENKKAREFLEKLGLSEPDKIAEVIEVILPKYQKDNIDVSEEENLTDVRKILQALSEGEKTRLTHRLQDTAFLVAYNNKTEEISYKKPSEIYLSEIYTGNNELETYFEGNCNVYFLGNSYRDFKKEQLLKLGCLDNIPVKYREPGGDGNIIIRNWHGDHKRGLNGFDPDCEIAELEHTLMHITVAKAQIVWKMLEQYHQSIYGTVESCGRQDYSNSKKNNQHSKMGKLVCEKKWLPDKNGDFRKPAELLLSELPDDFEKDSLKVKNLAGNLRMKKDIEQEYLAQLSESERENFEFAKEMTDEEVELIKKRRKQKGEDQEKIGDEDVNYAQEFVAAFNCPQRGRPEDNRIPPGPIFDPNRRKEKTQEEIEEDINNEPPIIERFKRVPIKKWERKNNEVRIFLKEQYSGKCQICDYTFIKRDGELYFEGLYMVSRTKRAWIDRPGNVLCLCANCCAKFEHGQIEAGNILEQISRFKYSNESGWSNAIIKIKLCMEDIELKFSERHILDLQEMLKFEMKEY